jgi:TonB family protein
MAFALSGGIHGLALIGFLLYHAFPPERPSVVPIFEMVSLEPPKLRPLRPKTPEPPPPVKEEVQAPEAPKLTPKPEKAVNPKKPEPKTLRESDSTLPVRDIPEETVEMNTTIVSNVPSDPRLAFWARRVKKRAETLWNPPAGIDVPSGAKTVITFEVSRDGSISAVEVGEASGNAMLDELAQRTILRLESTPPIPESYPEDLIKVSYEFLYSGH